MMYKRSQLEDAICKANRAERGIARTKLLARIKRLLDVDRTLGAKRGASPVQRYAFFSEAPRGSGQEASFTEYEIFALDVAVHIAMHGIQQSDIVELLRHLRPNLEQFHRELLTHTIDQFDFTMPVSGPKPKEAPQRWFLSVTAAGRSADFATKGGFTASLLKGGGEWWTHVFSDAGRTATIIELSVSPAFIREQLRVIEPRRKGRPR